jgi:hypothetical protein
MIDEISLARPKYIVFVGVDGSWLKAAGSNDLIFTWLYDYAKQNYRLAGLVNLVSPNRTDYYLDEVPTSLPTGLGQRIVIYQRNS